MTKKDQDHAHMDGTGGSTGVATASPASGNPTGDPFGLIAAVTRMVESGRLTVIGISSARILVASDELLTEFGVEKKRAVMLICERVDA